LLALIPKVRGIGHGRVLWNTWLGAVRLRVVIKKTPRAALGRRLKGSGTPAEAKMQHKWRSAGLGIG